MTHTCSGIEFIISNVDFEKDLLPFKISETMTLRSATEDEKKLFTKSCEANALNAKFIEFAQLKYWVIQFLGTNQKFIELEKVASLLNPKLHFGVHFWWCDSPNAEGNPTMGSYPSSKSLDILQKELRNESCLISKKELNKLKKYYDLFTKEDEIVAIKHNVLDLYFSCSLLYMTPSLLTMSLFSIIESLIAHKPRLQESLDSITHQIKNKLNLLFKRFDNKINHQDYFGSTDFQKSWTKLYALRSNITHGQIYNFEKDLSCLKSLDNVNSFLDKVVQELIKLLLDEPEFIIDIKAC